MSDISSTEKKRRFIMFCLLGVAVVAAILFLSFTVFAPEKPSASMTMMAARSEAITGQAGGEGSEEYNKKLEAHDTQRADAALQAGDSFSLADQAWIAAGKVGEKAGKIFERNFDRPPTVYLESGTPIGVLVLNVKESK